MEGNYRRIDNRNIRSFIKKGETKDELAGGIYVLRDKANKVNIDLIQ